MRVNVYAEEMTDRPEIISKEIDGHAFTGLRFYLELPATVNGQQHKGPFMHRPGDDDSSAVTFWGKRDLRKTLSAAQSLLDQHYEKTPAPAVAQPPLNGEYWPGQGGRYICTLPALLGMPARHLIAGEAEAEDMQFGPDLDVPGACSHIDGQANTAALLASGQGHPAAAWASAHTADGHTDFFLPARLDLLMAYIAAPQLFNKDDWYQSSTQGSRFGAFVQDFEYGDSVWFGKASEHRVRAFRAIHLNA